MNVNELYNTAKKYADMLKQEKSAFVSDDSSLCLIVTDKNELFTGVTGVRISGGKAETVHAEFNAIMSMKAADQAKAKQMITILFKDMSVAKPCDDCLDLLFRLSEDNNGCAVMTAPDSAASAMSLRFGTSDDSADMFSGFDFDDEPAADTSSLGAPADYAKAITVDESNPFNATSDEAQTEVVTFTGDSKDKAPEPAPEVQSSGDAQPEASQENAADSPVPVGRPELEGENKEPAMSMEDMLKQAKKRKKIAKANFNFFRR